MDPIFAALPDGFLPMIVFCLGVYFLTLGIRRVAELKWDALSQNKHWDKAVRTMPAFLGGIGGAFMHKYPFLSTLPSWGTRFIYGAFAGGVASFAYMVFKAVVQKYFGVKVPDGDSSTPPPPADGG